MKHHKKTNANFADKIKEKDRLVKQFKKDMEFSKVEFPEIPEE